MKFSDLLDKLMALELEWKDAGLSRQEIGSAYDMRSMALDEEEDEEADGEGEDE